MRARRLIYAEAGRITRSLHIWVGPLGLHLFFPDVWKSRPDYEPLWRRRP